MEQKDIDAIVNILLRESEIYKFKRTEKKRIEYIESLTDEVFIFIKKYMMIKYVDLVSSCPSSENFDAVWNANKIIGRMVLNASPIVAFGEGREFFGLENNPIKSPKEPSSDLIQIYAKHTEKNN